MRRRLSIGIALVTDPKVLVLDEPTTGLDPDTRNGLWNCINLAAKSRAVLLTTHSMEEADALCQRIGIMCNGSMTCLGTPLHLKNKFGSGYIITVALDMPMIIKAVLIDIITDNQRKASKDQEEKKESGKSVKKMSNLEVKLYQKELATTGTKDQIEEYQ
jgi:ABC-type multidrug transport system ATPase subunit